MRLFLAALTLIFVSACSPTATVQNVRTGVNTAVTGQRQVAYAASSQEVMNALLTLSARMQPDEAHTPYFVSNDTPEGMRLSSSPLTAGTNISNSKVKNAVKIVIDIETVEADGYTSVSFKPSPSDHSSAREARDDLIRALDGMVARYSS